MCLIDKAHPGECGHSYHKPYSIFNISFCLVFFSGNKVYSIDFKHKLFNSLLSIQIHVLRTPVKV